MAVCLRARACLLPQGYVGKLFASASHTAFLSVVFAVCMCQSSSMVKLPLLYPTHKGDHCADILAWAWGLFAGQFHLIPLASMALGRICRRFVYHRARVHIHTQGLPHASFSI